MDKTGKKGHGPTFLSKKIKQEDLRVIRVKIRL